jgi:single-stranded-DNA-specific exonuclease
MISVSGKKWIEKKINKNSIEKLKQDFNFSEIISKLIISRNFDLDEIYSIKNPSVIVNEFKKNNDFIAAASLLEKSIDKKELICIFGDYDVDGSAATSLLAKFFEYIKQPYFFFIPDRERDGYGPSNLVFKRLIKKKPKLIIMVDCGSTSNQSIEYLNSKKIKSIIIDHHNINKPYPKTDVLINPKKNINDLSKDYYCATTLTYFFLEIIIKKIKSSFNFSNYLIYVLLALVCDVMPLRKINRYIALNLIKNFKIKDNIVFKTLYELCQKKNHLTIEDLGFLIGPIINSGGRLSSSKIATDLLISENLSVVREKSLELIKLNKNRKEIENKILNEINFEKLEKENKNVIIYYSSKIKEGLIGIIASRLKDYFNKPSIVITTSQNKLKGSARSTINYNIGNVIKKLIDKKIIESGGGHNMAAGFSMKKDKLKDLEDFILEDFASKKKKLNLDNTYDAEISPNAINQNFINEINRIGPFGYGNPTPIFLVKNLKVIKARTINNKHINVMLKPKVGKFIKSICFNSSKTHLGRHLLSYKKNIHVVAQIHENYWNNNKYLQLNIKDLFIELN